MNKKNIPVKCVRCNHKFEAKEMVYYDNKFFCLQCTKTFNGCGSCKNQFYCDFKQNPVPIPKATIVERKEGPILINEKIPNPKRIKALCIEENCKCCVESIPVCARYFGTCSNYEEIDWDELNKQANK